MTEDVKDNVRNETLENLKLEYKEVHAYWRTLTDIRFKLLAFVPTLAGLGVVFISKNIDTLGPLGAFAVGLLGFIATLGITFYDQRNSELYDAAIERARHLEEWMKLKSSDKKFEGGIFCLRPARERKFFGILMWHDRGLAMVYASALGAWLFIIINSILQLRFWPSGTFSLLLAALLAIAIYLILQGPENGYLFSINTKFEGELNNSIISEELKKEFEKNGFSLSDNAAVEKEEEEEKKWAITDKKKFIIRKKIGKLNIYISDKPLEGARGIPRERGSIE